MRVVSDVQHLSTFDRRRFQSACPSSAERSLFQKTRWAWLVLACAMFCCMLPSGAALGQQRPGAKAPRRKLPELVPWRAKATVKAVRPGLLQVTTEKGEDWLVSIPRRVEAVVYQATATTGWLRRGMVVRFTARLDKRLRIPNAVSRLAVVTIRPGLELGIYPEADIPGKDELFTTPANGPEKKARPKPGVPTHPCVVIGRMLGSKKGSLSVAAGRSVLQVPIADNAEVSVEMNDYRMARPGDHVEVNARYLPSQPRRAQGERLTITAASPLAEVARVPRHRTPRETARSGNRKKTPTSKDAAAKSP